jgi:hypothetical protein
MAVAEAAGTPRASLEHPKLLSPAPKHRSIPVPLRPDAMLLTQPSRGDRNIMPSSSWLHGRQFVLFSVVLLLCAQLPRAYRDSAFIGYTEKQSG